VSSRVSSGVLPSSASVRPALSDSQPPPGCPQSHTANSPSVPQELDVC
jgi:hypothetical protein